MSSMWTLVTERPKMHRPSESAAGRRVHDTQPRRVPSQRVLQRGQLLAYDLERVQRLFADRPGKPYLKAVR